MKHGIREIDHLLTYVKSLDEASRSYERLGFFLTPRSDIAGMGVANRLVLLQARTPDAANFIELMGVTDAARLPAAMQPLLSGEAGVKSMVMVTDDAAETQKALSTSGFAFGAPHHVKREWVLPGEGSVWPEFDVLLPIPGPLPFNVCQYHNLDLYLRPDWQQHPNTALSLLAVFAVTPNPVQEVRDFEMLFGEKRSRVSEQGLNVTPGSVELILETPQGFQSRLGMLSGLTAGPDVRYAGMRIGVADIATLKACLRDGDVPFVDHADRAIVGPDAACGNVIEFVGQVP